MNNKYNENKKYETIVHYIINSCDDIRKLGSIKLNKILFYSDCDMFIRKNKTITNDKYIKRQYGPVPKKILTILSNLEKKKKISIRKPSQNRLYDTTLYFSLTDDMDLDILTAEEVSILEHYLKIISNNYTAKEISEISHDRIWELADLGEEIPIYTIHASETEEINADDIEALSAAL
ncbi:Panacea domain-containing protein [Brachyspira hyodysenteriae]|uniref:Antitoxin SocA-like Panacea domain-containing protein n=2 Tax=Brachyspira hyodysenteriae TaxID=159 RepID=A0A3B6VGN8_BRAHW|nr:Panacea domain-containing protein [Brachyspira hyodysenteriae]ACN85031.1 hypothetical protein BHWA1_02578 [Brachyspira hyodysenteriae WA1]ANN62937.1 hypothetical protein BHYOB78_03390 [Brachyspira hyodysenteriae ATCC 27164]AUJ50749.1 hypothetical protein BH718_02320 [Brachyspira hyodysenteriae]KLI13513.1 hypothetical protein SU45_13435 [Brachyspira hyodysenteriae]KLI17933.1 hypothetical protein SU44_03025 [Brachyspira hyodysenteriae]